MKWVISNLKMNMTLTEILDYEKQLSSIKSKNNLIVCPSFPFLMCFNGNNYYLGTQNVASQEDGSLTGEVSARQLKSLGVGYAIIGHYERRHKLFETNAQIREKIKVLFANDICPILCIGENNYDDDIESCINNDLEEIFSGITNIKNIIIAYEPVWAIGTGNIPKNDYIERMVNYIKNWFYNKYNVCVDVVYGSSVSVDNIAVLNEVHNLDGYLLGATCLDIESLKVIVKYMEVQK